MVPEDVKGEHTHPSEPSLPPAPPPPHDTDDVVERAVERAATKVAEAASPTTNGGPPLLNKFESIAAVAVIVIVGLSNFIINLQTKSELNEHKGDFKAICQIIIDQAPPEKTKDLAELLAECIK